MNDYEIVAENAFLELERAYDSGEFAADLEARGALDGLAGQARADKVEEELEIAKDAIRQEYNRQFAIAEGIADSRELREDSPADDFEVE